MKKSGYIINNPDLITGRRTTATKIVKLLRSNSPFLINCFQAADK